MKTPRRLSLALALSALAAPIAPAAAQDAPRPNVLVILTDDIGWGDYPCYNPQSKIPAPNVDRLAREGMRFTHAHVPAALCAPTRYSMVTGNYPWRGRAPGGTWGFNVPSQLLPGQKTVANLLKDAGYQTAIFGKQGFGGEYAKLAGGRPDFTQPMIDGPKRWGFDYSFIIPRGHQNTPHVFMENERPSCGPEKLVRGEGPADYAEPGWNHRDIGARLLDRAEKFIDDVLAHNRASGHRAPFFMHFCTDGAHSPYEPAEAIRGTALRGKTNMTAHTDMVMETDVLLGKLREILDQRGLLANTLICFTSDNGGIPAEQHLGHDAVGGLRGMKSYIPEGGHRVPFIVSWPAAVRAGTVRHQIVGAHDIVPTVLELAGIAIPADQCLDAVSLAPVLLGRRDDSRPVRKSLLVQSSPGRDAFDDAGIKGGPLTGQEKPRLMKELFAKNEEGGKATKRAAKKAGGSDGMAHALYEGNWKLIINSADTPVALYDLEHDLQERKNLIADPTQAARVQSMAAGYRAIRGSKASTSLSAAAP